MCVTACYGAGVCVSGTRCPVVFTSAPYTISQQATALASVSVPGTQGQVIVSFGPGNVFLCVFVSGNRCQVVFTLQVCVCVCVCVFVCARYPRSGNCQLWIVYHINLGNACLCVCQVPFTLACQVVYLSGLCTIVALATIPEMVCLFAFDA
jgi:hypothetical protein